MGNSKKRRWYYYQVDLERVKTMRAVINSVTTLYITKPTMARGVVMQLKKVLAGLGCTSILISQVSVTERGLRRARS